MIRLQFLDTSEMTLPTDYVPIATDPSSAIVLMPMAVGARERREVPLVILLVARLLSSSRVSSSLSSHVCSEMIATVYPSAYISKVL